MPFEIAKRFAFDAAHSLPHLPRGHKCRRPHGHTYVVTVYLGAEDLDERGFVEDYAELDDVKHFIDRDLDHRDLNQILPAPTTAECIARYLFDCFKSTHPLLTRVDVAETPNTVASYRA